MFLPWFFMTKLLDFVHIPKTDKYSLSICASAVVLMCIEQ